MFPLSALPFLLAAFLHAAPASSSCTSAQRIAGAEQIPYAYNLPDLGASAAAFAQVPFADDCIILIYPNGLPPVQVATDKTTTIAFADESRQVFSDVTGEYTDFSNGTTIIATNVTIGVRSDVPVPVTFYANVYLTYDLTNCEIDAVQAYAQIPTEVLGLLIDPPEFGGLNLP